MTRNKIKIGNLIEVRKKTSDLNIKFVAPGERSLQCINIFDESLIGIVMNLWPMNSEYFNEIEIFSANSFFIISSSSGINDSSEDITVL